ncbi:MAG: phage integrase N-terminal SAM-like domain-containing protein [Gammaproteobacteria bacterium]|jgi:hypothetical protein|nr:phage integrase N-terminal SAM-like domain-containing protein [Gammaproteobacteria bacterium]
MKRTSRTQNNVSPGRRKSTLTSDTNQLKAQFLADMELAGMVAKSRKAYLDSVEQLLRYYWCSPAELTEQQVGQYLLERHRCNLAKGTFKVMKFGLRFFFNETLERDWHLFKKK